MQMRNPIEAGVTEVRLQSPADYSAMKEELIRKARAAQAAAIRAAFAGLTAAIVAFATRLNHPPRLSSLEHGD